METAHLSKILLEFPAFSIRGWTPLLSHIKIVLVGTTHPGNIGAAARAMKTMGLRKLVLVAPKIFPHAEATARAAGADDLLQNAVVYQQLPDAIADCQFVVASSVRKRSIPLAQVDPRQCAEKLLAQTSAVQVAVLFGREDSGLSNNELDLAHCLMRIPSNPQFSSLNLASAVQLLCYELMMTSRGNEVNPAMLNQANNHYATVEQMELFYQHLAEAMGDTGFLIPEKSSVSLLRRMRRLFNRARMEQREVDIMRGFLSAIQNHKQSQ